MAATVAAFVDLLEQARAAGLALGLGEAGVEVGLERVQDAVRAVVAGGGQELVEVGVAKAAYGLAAEVQAVGDGVDRPALSARWWMSSKRWRVRSMIWVRGSSGTGSSIATGSGTITELRSEL
ncbi:hypothetical protein [Streptomyces sp. NPDC056661]|uniref:hypothetical protein n=1 Tax=Streptomyces sp. NPDC056661 TaxID=3345898 RepID=UPI00367FBD01